MRIDLRWARGETITNTTGIARGHLVVFQLAEPNSSGLKIARVLGLTVPLALFAITEFAITDESGRMSVFVQVFGRSTPAQSTGAP